MLESAALLCRPTGMAWVQRLLWSLRGQVCTGGLAAPRQEHLLGLRSVASATVSDCSSQGLRGILPRADTLGSGWSSLAVAKWRISAMGNAVSRQMHRGYATGREGVEQRLQFVFQVRQQQQGPRFSIRTEPYSTESLQQGWAVKWKSFRQSVQDATSSKGAAPGTGLRKANGGTQKVLKETVSVPGAAFRRSVSRYREAAQLQIEAFWKRNYLIVVGAAAVVLCLLLWRVMFGIASTFVGLSEGMAKFGFLALAAAFVAFAGLIVRARYTINPDAVYRTAVRKLNASAALLEVLGAPLTGTDVRAYVMSGGGLKLKSFKPRLTGKRCFLIFPIKGSERRGLVSVEAKKKKGQYEFKLLAVDIPTAGVDQRIFLIGDENEYKVGGGLISELREPILKAMEAQKEFDDEDEREAEEEERQELLQAEKNRKEQQKKQIDA